MISRGNLSFIGSDFIEFYNILILQNYTQLCHYCFLFNYMWLGLLSSAKIQILFSLRRYQLKYNVMYLDFKNG